MQQTTKIIGASVLLWVILMVFIFFNFPSNHKDEILEFELKQLKNGYADLQRQSSEMKKQIQNLQKQVEDEEGEDQPKGETTPIKATTQKSSGSQKSTEQTQPNEMTTTQSHSGASSGLCCRGPGVEQPYSDDCNKEQFRPKRDFTQYPAGILRSYSEDEKWYKNCDIPCINSVSWSNQPGLPDAVFVGNTVCKQQVIELFEGNGCGVV